MMIKSQDPLMMTKPQDPIMTIKPQDPLMMIKPQDPVSSTLRPSNVHFHQSGSSHREVGRLIIQQIIFVRG